jgi:hypothetical protein
MKNKHIQITLGKKILVAKHTTLHQFKTLMNKMNKRNYKATKIFKKKILNYIENRKQERKKKKNEGCGKHV